VSYLEDNLGALNVTLTPADEEEIREDICKVPVAGERYQPAMMKMVNA
jgi:hypothetical protein